MSSIERKSSRKFFPRVIAPLRCRHSGRAQPPLASPGSRASWCSPDPFANGPLPPLKSKLSTILEHKHASSFAPTTKSKLKLLPPPDYIDSASPSCKKDAHEPSIKKRLPSLMKELPPTPPTTPKFSSPSPTYHSPPPIYDSIVQDDARAFHPAIQPTVNTPLIHPTPSEPHHPLQYTLCIHRRRSTDSISSDITCTTAGSAETDSPSGTKCDGGIYIHVKNYAGNNYSDEPYANYFEDPFADPPDESVSNYSEEPSASPSDLLIAGPSEISDPLDNPTDPPDNSTDNGLPPKSKTNRAKSWRHGRLFVSPIPFHL